MVARAWVCDDAYITFRVVDNAVHGHGLRWNVDERVEVYTHPLWMLLHLPFHAVTGNPFLTTLALGTLCTAGALGLAAGAHRGRPLVTALVLLLPLAGSRAFVEYATSGLENPLSFLLFAWFGWLLVRRREAPPGLGLGLAVGLALLNRLDTLFLFAPPFLYVLWTERRQVRWPRLLSGLAPIALWEAFRLLYYGFPLPNTAYAKLDAGPPRGEYLERGVRYAADLLNDPVSLALLVGGLGAGLAGLRAWRDPRSPAARSAGVALGGLCYAGYVVWIGGDFMAGRFWALPVFVAAWCLHGAVVAAPRGEPALAVLATLALALLLQPSAAERAAHRSGTGIRDERAFYAPTNALFAPEGAIRSNARRHPWARYGLQLREEHRAVRTAVYPAMGMVGYFAGPEVTVIDELGLTDPLLARIIPPSWDEDWRIGHIRRPLPRGYISARATGRADAMDPGLAEYFEKLRLATAAPLFDPERLRTLVPLNLGAYDQLLRDGTR